MNTRDPRWAGSRPDDECGHFIPLVSSALFGGVVVAVVYLATSAPIVLVAGVLGLYGAPVVVSLIADRLTTRRHNRRRTQLRQQQAAQQAAQPVSVQVAEPVRGWSS